MQDFWSIGLSYKKWFLEMNRHHENLIHAKATIHESDFVLMCLKNFENDFHRNLLSPDEFQRCIVIVNEIRDLSQAACAGILAARRVVDEVMGVSKSLESYSSREEKVGQHKAGRINKKF